MAKTKAKTRRAHDPDGNVDDPNDPNLDLETVNTDAPDYVAEEAALARNPAYQPDRTLTDDRPDVLIGGVPSESQRLARRSSSDEEADTQRTARRAAKDDDDDDTRRVSRRAAKDDDDDDTRRSSRRVDPLTADKLVDSAPDPSGPAEAHRAARPAITTRDSNDNK